MDNPLISVIVPVYKVEKYLDRCVESIVNQTYTNLEIILVDDGSPDNCPAMCDAWAEKDNRIKVIHKENGGLSSARNAGLDVYNGQLLMFVDSDDWVDDDIVSLMYESMLNNSTDMVSCSLYYESNVVEVVTIKDELFCGADIQKAFLMDEIRPEAWAKLYKRELIAEQRFDTSVRYAEDIPFNFAVFGKAMSLIQLNCPKYHYYICNSSSITGSGFSKARAESYKTLEKIIDSTYGDSELNSVAIWRFVYNTFGLLNKSLSDDGLKELYADDISNALLRNKQKIMKCKKVSIKYKFFGILLSVNKSIYYKLYKIKRAIR